jgi:hypothetical protein
VNHPSRLDGTRYEYLDDNGAPTGERGVVEPGDQTIYEVGAYSIGNRREWYLRAPRGGWTILVKTVSAGDEALTFTLIG